MFKQGILAIALSTSLFASSAKQQPTPQPTTVTYTVDTKASNVKWQGHKQWVKSTHNGTVMLKSGSVVIEKGIPIRAEFIIDMTTIVDLDLTDKEYNAKLVGHLSSDDFFAVKTHPEALFVVEKFELVKDKNYIAQGKATIRGKTKELSLPIEISLLDDKSAQAHSTFQLKRTEFDVKYNSPGLLGVNIAKDKLIKDEIDLEITITAKSN